MQRGAGFYHFHKRKRIYQKYEPYPSSNKWKSFVDKSVYLIAIVSPIMTLPQLIKIWTEKSSQGLSIMTWGTYLIASSIWMVYGIIHKEKPIVFTNVLWIVLQTIIVIGVLMY